MTMRAQENLQDVAPAVPGHVPTLLSFVAGYVDSCTFLGLFGLFVAQVTGSFVVAGSHLVTKDPDIVIKVVGIPVFFLAGMATTVLAVIAARRGRSALAATLALECALLIGFLLVAAAGTPLGGPNAPAAFAASLFGLSAMGVQSALVRLLMRGMASTNVMTTNTSQLSIDVAQWLLAWHARRRTPADATAAAELAAATTRCAVLLPVVVGFLVGTVAGALAYLAAGFWCLVLAIVVVLALAIWASRR
jgi:uncharacterized membrane protein YoaK (UPF0700 family)